MEAEGGEAGMQQQAAAAAASTSGAAVPFHRSSSRLGAESFDGALGVRWAVVRQFFSASAMTRWSRRVACFY